MKRIDIANKPFGKLIAVEIDTEKSGKGKGSFWKCRCSCGGTKTVRLSNLTRKYTKSCGCDWFNHSPNGYGTSSCHPSFTGIGDMPGTYYSGIKREAGVRKHEFNVSKEYLWDLFLKQKRQCALSGMDIWFRKDQHIADGTASLDRIDSSRGYVKGNLQWVHKDVNRMKQKFTNEHFVSMCKRIAERH